MIIDQVARLADSGIAEVVLTGVDITSWGSDFEGNRDGKTGLGRLVQEILAQVPRLPRLRLSSIDPSEIGDLMAKMTADAASASFCAAW